MHIFCSLVLTKPEFFVYINWRVCFFWKSSRVKKTNRADGWWRWWEVVRAFGRSNGFLSQRKFRHWEPLPGRKQRPHYCRGLWCSGSESQMHSTWILFRNIQLLRPECGWPFLGLDPSGKSCLKSDQLQDKNKVGKAIARQMFENWAETERNPYNKVQNEAENTEKGAGIWSREPGTRGILSCKPSKNQGPRVCYLYRILADTEAFAVCLRYWEFLFPVEAEENTEEPWSQIVPVGLPN